MAGKSVPKAAKAKRSAASTKAEAWDPNSEQQWEKDKAAGGAAWAERFINTAGPEYGGGSLRECIRDAGLLFEGNEDELGKFYETLQSAIVAMPAKLLECHLEGIEDRISKTATVIAAGSHYLDGESDGATMVRDALELADEQMVMAQEAVDLLKAKAGIRAESQVAA